MPVTPSSPQSICTSCFDTLKISSDFKKTCLESNEIFNENFQVEESQISDLHVPDMFDFIEVSNGCQTGENQVSDDEMDVVDNAPDESSEEKFLDKMLDAKTRFMQMMDQCKEGTNQSGRGRSVKYIISELL